MFSRPATSEKTLPGHVKLETLLDKDSAYQLSHQLSATCGGGTPDMVAACSKALLAAQGTLASIHQVAKKLPACGRLIAAQPLCLCHTATQLI